ncbi:hypothetical protein MKW92_009755 [Papaver armeniacum]|nr:hypothetical protein MKW92_009755 [Papaver armeniacum]
MHYHNACTYSFISNCYIPVYPKYYAYISNYNAASARRKLVLDDNTGNYDSWKIDMKDHLRSLDLWGIVDGSESSDKSLPDKFPYVAKCSNNWESKDRKALRIINMACGPVLSCWIEDAPTAKCAWDRLSRAHNLHNVKYNATAASTVNLNEVLTGDVTDYNSWKDLDEIILVDLSNFDSWRIYMEKYLRSQDLWNVVHGKKDCPTANMKAYGVIKMACGPQLVYEFVGRDSSAKRAWKDLRNAYTMHRGTNPLTPTNYEIWKVHLKKILRKNKLWSRVKLDSYYFNDDIDKKAYEFIANSCSQEMLPHIIYTTNPKEAWDQLKQAEAASVEEKERYRKMVVAAETAMANVDKLKRANDEHLTLSNYRHFKVYLKQLLISKYLWDIVDGNEVATVHNFPIWKNKNKAALELIRSSCGTEMQPHAKGTNFAQEAWYKLARAAGASDEEKDPYTRYLPLDDPFQNDEVIRGFAREFLVSFPETISCRMSDEGLTLLHSSIIKGKLVLAKYLIDMLSPKALEIKTDNGQLAISLAVKYNNMEMVKLMVDKNRKLLLLQNEYGHIPFVTSAICGDQEMMRYLYSETPMEKIVYNQILGDKYGAILVTAALRVDLYDVALDLLKLLPGLATVEDNNGMTVFHVLAAKPSAFLSGHRYGYFQKHLYWSAGVCSNGPFAKALKAIVPYIRQLSDEKVKHDQAVQIVKIICPQLSRLDVRQLRRVGAYDAIYSTTIHGIVEFFTVLTNSNPFLIHYKDGNGNGLYQHAVISRQEKIFNLISQMGLQKQGTELFDKDMNNILHCAGFWRPPQLINVSGAALQMQREIQWFQEVEKVVNLKYREMKNKKGTKPKDLFTVQHKSLVKEGEKWIKEASQACMVVSTLIATVMFAAAFTVPGGNNQNTGYPMFLNARAFMVFIVSDAVSLFASCTSILMFFTLLTARYAEQDFLKSLPRKLILGLFFLFVSIAFMMATFAATLVIVLHEKVPWVYAPVILLATIPVVLFGALQFPLFFDIVSSTFGRGIFHRNQSVLEKRQCI